MSTIQANTGRSLVKLKNLDSYIDRKVNLVAVVVEFSIPRPCLGTDFVTTLKIIDQSQHDPEICVNIFAGNVDHLPVIRSHKDIIVLSNVRIQQHGQHPSAVFNKTFSAFALFDGKDYDNFTPYQASPTFGPLDVYNVLIRQLRNWCQIFPFDAGISEFAVPIKELKKGYFDIVCKILHACEIVNEWVIFVWDGTDAPLLSLNSKLGDDKNNPLALHIEQMPLPADVFCKFPCLGTVLRVVTAKAYRNLGDHFNGVGTWARIRNMRLEPHSSGLWMGALTENTKFRLLSEDDNSVKERIKNYKERIEESRRPSSFLTTSDFLTVTDHRDVSYATLMDLLTLSFNHGRFKCIVRVVSIFPSQAQDFWSHSHKCYSILMTLEDPTARIHALLCANDARVFFEGYPTLDALTMKMNKLLGVTEGGPRNPPWTEFCLQLLPPIEGDPSGRKQFHICDTRFAPNS